MFIMFINYKNNSSIINVDVARDYINIYYRTKLKKS